MNRISFRHFKKQNLSINPLPTQGFFNSSITPKAPKTSSNTCHHLPPRTQILSHFPRQKNNKQFHPQQSQTPLFSIPTNTSIPPAQLPNAPLRIAITNAIHLLLHQQAADQLGGNLLGGAGEEGLREALGGRGGYGYGFVWNCRGVLRAVDNLITAHPAQLPQHFQLQ
jgi:hypothetical protein